MDAGLAVRAAFILHEGGPQGGHAASASEAFRVPVLVESLNVGLTERNRVVATSAVSLGHTLRMDRSTVAIDQVGACDWVVAF